MINVVQGHRTNSVQEAINYLKGDHDHKGVERKSKPRFLAGSETDCLVACESIDRKHKYVSGTLAFEPGEHPTDKQLLEVVKAFRATFMAGLEHGVNFTDFWNIHTDKNRVELNYIIPLTELTTGKRINPFPPGQAKEDFKQGKISETALGYFEVREKTFPTFTPDDKELKVSQDLVQKFNAWKGVDEMKVSNSLENSNVQVILPKQQQNRMAVRM